MYVETAAISKIVKVMLVAIRMRKKKKMIYWIIIDRHLNLEFLVPLDYDQETSFLVALLVLLVYQILRSPGFLDLFHKLAY